NGDGWPDILVANSQGDKFSLFLSTGGGAFGNVKNIRIGTAQRWIALDDLDGDGNLDIVFALMNQNSFIAGLGTGAGAFHFGNVVNLGGTYLINRLSLGRLDGDTFPDLVTVSQAGDGTSPGQMVVLLGNGDATFTEHGPRQATGSDPEGLVILDLD